MNNSKPMLLSLSLAGAIGFYLYNKLIQTGNVTTLSPNMETCEDKTRRELQPRILVTEQPQPTLFEDAVETVAPVESEVVEKDEFDTLLEANTEAPVLDTMADVPPVVGGDDNAMSFDDLMNMANEEESASLLDEDEIVEPVVEELIEEPAPAPTFVSLEKERKAPEEVDFTTLILETPTNDGVVDLLEEKEESVAVAEQSVVENKHKDKGFKSLEEMPIADLIEMDKQALMENAEALHNVDAKDPAAKREFDSIMDFFNEL